MADGTGAMAAAMRAQVKALQGRAAPSYKETLAKAPTRLYIVVRRHDRPPFSEHETGDTANYLWVVADSKVAVNSVLNAYKKGHDDLSDICLYTDRGVLLQAQQRFYDIPYRDQLIVLTAALPGGTSKPAEMGHLQASPISSATRAPLQPIQPQATVSSQDSDQDKLSNKQSQPSPVPALSNTSMPMRSPSKLLQRTSATSPKKAGSSAAPPIQSSPSMPIKPDRPPQLYQTNDSAPPPASIKRELQDDSTLAGAELDGAESPRPANPWKFEPDDEDTGARQHGLALQELTKDDTPERLEAGVTAGLAVLDRVEAILEQVRHLEDAKNWLAQIGSARQEAIKSRTVVGVVGNTGAGKSSVINAMLDESRLVPTNCMRACTAVVTEISYNYSSSPRAKYRAEIEFIKPEDWQRELETLFRDVFDDSNNFSREISNPESDAGIAYAKIRAVYHKHTREMLQKSSIDSLMRQTHVSKVLGQVRKLYDQDPGSFYRQLQGYVDSKEKTTEAPKLDKLGRPIVNKVRKFEFWPLIKVVKIYTKSDALSTGAIVVDLPGVHDSNAARAAVAEGYMKQCTGLWIVAPITRAVDDKAAKSLLGDTFKRQLKFDGTYSAVTFICSKTDDISLTEAEDSLDLGAELEVLSEEYAKVQSQRAAITRELKKVKDDISDYEATLEQVDDDLEIWEELEEKVESGNTVYPPLKKRKRAAAAPATSRKRQQRSLDSDSDDDFQHAHSSPGYEDTDATDADAQPLTDDDISSKIEELKTMKKEARRAKRGLEEQRAGIRARLSEFDVLLEANDAKRSALCISGRNNYSRGAIQQDFAAGIKELDQETAADEDPDNFNPEEDIRDYDAVAKQLPVFCVSSRAYQKLSGRHEKDAAVSGFTDIRETEVPQLQAHCKKLTEKGRQASCRRFLNTLKQLLASLALWASDDGTGVKLTTQQRDAEKSLLSRKLRELEKALEWVVNDTFKDVASTLDSELFSKFDPAVQAAVDNAAGTSSRWGAHRTARGLYWSTYKAVVRRNGVYQSSAAGLMDFNGQLAEPLYKNLGSTWEKAFQRRLPSILRAFTKSATATLTGFHGVVEQRFHDQGQSISRITMLRGQLNAYTAIFEDLVSTAVQQLNEGQRELNREFTPVICDIMTPAYERCTAESGGGQYNRMKNYMTNHISNERDHMFDAAADRVRNGLKSLCKSIKKVMLDKADAVFVNMQRDYGTIVGFNGSGIKLSREERTVRVEIDAVLTNSETVFQETVDKSIEELRAQMGDSEQVGLAADEVDVDFTKEEEVEDSEEEDGFLSDESSFVQQAGDDVNDEDMEEE